VQPDNRLNPYENVLDASNASGLKLKWTFQANFWVQSSPAVANGVVYVGSGDFFVYALSASTGVRLWSFYTGEVIYSPPSVANGVLYVGATAANKVFAFGLTGGAGTAKEPQP
jgi:outer membrane protein assembly factor BamB